MKLTYISTVATESIKILSVLLPSIFTASSCRATSPNPFNSRAQTLSSSPSRAAVRPIMSILIRPVAAPMLIGTLIGVSRIVPYTE